MTLPKITITSIRGRGFIVTDQYGNAKVCKTQAGLEKVIENWASGQQRDGESDDALAHLMGDPVVETNSKSNEGRRFCYICGGELIWGNDYDSSDVYGMSDDDGGIVSIWYCSRCGREYSIADPDKETRIKEYNDYWQEDTDE